MSDNVIKISGLVLQDFSASVGNPHFPADTSGIVHVDVVSGSIKLEHHIVLSLRQAATSPYRNLLFEAKHIAREFLQKTDWMLDETRTMNLYAADDDTAAYFSFILKKRG